MLLSSSVDQVAAALSRIPSGAGILTAAHGDQRSGMLASWFQQASFEPPVVTVALRKGRPIQLLVDSSAAFTLNIAGEHNVGAWFKHFARGFALHEDAFRGVPIEPTEFGPVLPEGAAALGCRVLGRLDPGDHVIYAGQVIAAFGDLARAPYVHVRRNGLSY